MNTLFRSLLITVITLFSCGLHSQEREITSDEGKAAIKRLFSSMSSYRGVFGKNIIQSTWGRRVTPNFPPGERLFQGIFRGDSVGRPLARDYDFYAGNMFSSNYFELFQEFVYGEAANASQSEVQSYRSARILDPDLLLDNKEEAMARASMMMRHWVLEKYYVGQVPGSKLASSFQKWGAGDSKDEQTYATHFFNFYLSSINSELQHLPAFLLIRQVPVGDGNKTPSLQRARDLVWDFPKDRSTALGRIRNAIHNQLSPSVIPMIDDYGRRYGLPYKLKEARRILVDFFRADPSKVAEIASSLGLNSVADAAYTVNSDPSIENLTLLSTEVAAVKKQLTTEAIAFENKTDALLLLSRTSQYLNAQLNNDEKYSDEQLSSTQGVVCLINLHYIEGLLVKKNWEYFLRKVEESSDLNDRSKILKMTSKIATDTIVKAFTPSLAKWELVETKMNKFVDDMIKSSSLNASSTLLLRLGGG